MDTIGTYEERPFLKSRLATIDTVAEGRRKHHIPVLLELDVTQARDWLRAHKARTGESLSFTGWLVTCLARAVSEHKHIHAMRRGRRKLVVFDDVDVAIVVERTVRRADGGTETLPMPYVVRRGQEKSVWQVHDEIRRAQTAPVDAGDPQLGPPQNARLVSLFFSLPQFLRRWLLWRRLTHDPFHAKQTMGTVIVTSVGMFAREGGYAWAIPTGLHPLVVTVGPVVRKPGVVGDEIGIRETLSVTVLFDHDVTDGAPVARFLTRFRELVESGYGLGEETATETLAQDEQA
jgi:pyruvate/2-oxoglutarate dehydrogenase complex dihydrolipoamide acyltransferase (E2) component